MPPEQVSSTAAIPANPVPQGMPADSSTAFPNSTSATDPPALSKSQLEAQIIEDVFPAALLASSASKSLKTAVSAQGYQAYLKNLLGAAGDPKDPLEVMLIQQLAAAHQRIGDLHAQSACASSSELALAYNQAAGKLMAEFRKSTLALRQYRSPIVPKQVTLVTGNEQVALIDSETGKRSVSENTGNNELSTKPARLNHVEYVPPFPAPGCGTGEPAEAKRVNGNGTRTAQSSDLGESPLGVFNWATNGRR